MGHFLAGVMICGIQNVGSIETLFCKTWLGSRVGTTYLPYGTKGCSYVELSFGAQGEEHSELSTMLQEVGWHEALQRKLVFLKM